MDEQEVDAQKGKDLAGQGRNVYVFMNSLQDLELARQVLGAGNNAQDIDMGEARMIMFRHAQRKELMEHAAKFEGSLIVCPHGRTSLEFVHALSELGIKAYSLHGGIEGLKSRA